MPSSIIKSQNPEEVKRMRVVKEGSRRGQEINVNAKFCGMAFFCTAVSEPNGDFKLLEQSLVTMNAECTDIGKMLFSDGPEQLAIIACVPDVHATALNCEEWLLAVVLGIGGTIVKTTGTYGKVVVRASAD